MLSLPHLIFYLCMFSYQERKISALALPQPAAAIRDSCKDLDSARLATQIGDYLQSLATQRGLLGNTITPAQQADVADTLYAHCKKTYTTFCAAEACVAVSEAVRKASNLNGDKTSATEPANIPPVSPVQINPPVLPQAPPLPPKNSRPLPKGPKLNPGHMVPRSDVALRSSNSHMNLRDLEPRNPVAAAWVAAIAAVATVIINGYKAYAEAQAAAAAAADKAKAEKNKADAAKGKGKGGGGGGEGSGQPKPAPIDNGIFIIHGGGGGGGGGKTPTVEVVWDK
ncbi:hypothetical protein EJ08DRAFT_700722 [Tothia fuscella]|uniref:Uncharacterized protein n=1 Tax=Tothia fuscella TaxID=1048955 RepID=A0A9P4TVB4_9PEZI|nr:hypothetical protein EJ08DRAFT_700722 [Tothia fuscella]